MNDFTIQVEPVGTDFTLESYTPQAVWLGQHYLISLILVSWHVQCQ